MNTVITSKEAIMQVCRRIVAEKGMNALNMRLVADECGIALGTLYNYFADKDDLIEYLMGDYCRMMEQMLEKMFRAGRLDIFEAAQKAVIRTVEFSMEEGREALCSNLFSCMRMNRRFSFEKVMDGERTLVASGLPYIDRERFRDASDEAVALLLDMLVVLARNTIARVFTDPENREAYLTQFSRKLEMIKHGVVLPDDQ